MKVWGVLIFLIATAAPGTAAAATRYSIINLGTFGGTEGQATGINNSGEVSGSAKLTGDLTSHASLYSGGVLNDLGALSVVVPRDAVREPCDLPDVANCERAA